MLLFSNILILGISLITGWFLNSVESAKAFLVLVDSTHLSTIVSTYSFTMLGFMTTGVSILLALSNSRAIRKFKEEGHMGTFLKSVGFSGLFLFALFALSLVFSGQGVDKFWVSLILCTVCASFLQHLLHAFVIWNLTHRTFTETTDKEINDYMKTTAG